MNPESGTAASFEEQFANREKFGERGISVLDVSPPNPKHTALFILGWNAHLDEYRKIFTKFYNSGVRVVAPELAGLEKQKAEDIKLLTIDKSLRRIDVVAHSVGAISAVSASLENPSLPTRLILINSAGLMGEDDDRELIKRYSNLVSGRKKDDSQVNAGGDQVKKMARAINSFKMYDNLQFLKGLGVDIQILHSRDDVLFPYDRVAQEASSHGWDVSEISGSHLSLDYVDFSKLGYGND